MNLDYLKTLAWCDWQRLKAGRLPLLRMPKDRAGGQKQIPLHCPVARALPGEASVGPRDYMFMGQGIEDPRPTWVREKVRR